MRTAGWYRDREHDDPPDTFRYWDGAGWTDAVMTPEQRSTSSLVVAPAPTPAPAPASYAVPAPPPMRVGTAGGYDLIAPEEPPPPAAAMGHVVRSGPRDQRSNQSRFRGSRADRLVSSGAGLLIFGLILGIAGHNIVTVFDTPTEIQGTVTESRETRGRRSRLNMRVEVSTAVGEFYTSGRTSYLEPNVQQALRNNRRLEVTVGYSERTGGLMYIDDLAEDRLTIGRFLWPGVALVSLALALVRIRYEYNAFGDGLVFVFIALYFLAAPIAGWLAVDALDGAFTTLVSRP